ncbi:MAG: PD-(D/E)XK nuclease family protein [Bacteroidales bacterium]|nr:PD-(D/E)XK nuclease family protein [Bacteroidales bacterium]
MAEQQKFLEKVADFLLEKCSDGFTDTVVVFPNHRSIVFLKKYLSRKTAGDLWLPDMVTIDELMIQLSGLTVVDPLLAEFELFKIHSQIAGSEARSLDDFLGWAPLILNDFSDIDYYLADTGKLFDELSEIKVLEKWNLGEQPLTDLQKNYLEFFRSLTVYYTKLHQQFLKKNLSYKAMAYRYVAEHTDVVLEKGTDWNHFIFAGINALTPSEIAVVKALKDRTLVDFLVDADRFYFDNQGKNTHEASVFLKKSVKELHLDPVQWIERHLLDDQKKIEVVGVPQQMGQVRFAGTKLFEWITENPENLQNTAVVLADEGLLMPLLSYVPIETMDNKPIPYNVTLGYSLSESPLFHLVSGWLDLLIVQQNSSAKFPLNEVMIFLKNPVFELFSPATLSDLITKLKQENNSFIEPEKLKLFCDQTENRNLFNLFFSPGVGFDKLLHHLIRFLQEVQKPLEEHHGLLHSQVSLLFRVLKNLSIVLDNVSGLGLQAFRKILLREIQRQQVSLKGEPLTGVQIMGLLETRNLDFKNLIILSANEGILPKTGFQDSFIPFDLKRSYGMPLPNNKTSVFSYHVFRLLQRAENIVFVYNTEPDVLGGGEPSRFILQMEQELMRANPRIQFTKRILPIAVKNTELGSDILIERTATVKNKLSELAQSGIAPSAINSFVNCSLQFYFKYVLRTKVPDNSEKAIESDTFGNVIHGVLQKIYSQFRGENIDRTVLKTTIQELDPLLAEQFQKHYGQSDFVYGKNRLIYQVAKEYLRRFLESEADAKQARKLMAVELPLSHQMQIDGMSILFKGKIDRVDEYAGGMVQILDYKTGRVDNKDVKAKDLNLLYDDPQFSKALQVASYGWLFHKNNPGTASLQAGLISLRSASGQIQNVSYNDENLLLWMTQFETGLVHLLKQIFLDEEPFSRTRDINRCTYCDFKNLCNR